MFVLKVNASSILTHPEDVVDEQPPQQDAAGADVVQVKQLHPVEGERQAKQVIGYPVLWCHNTHNNNTDDMISGDDKQMFHLMWLYTQWHHETSLSQVCFNLSDFTFLSRYQTPTTLLMTRHTRFLVSNS